MSGKSLPKRQRAGEETTAFEKLEEPVLDVPVYSFEEVLPSAGPDYEVPEMLELPELTEVPDEPAHVFDAFDVTAEIDIIREEASGTPVLSFDEVATMEEPQPAFQGGMEEIDLGASSFDFNLEGLSALQSEPELEEASAMPTMPDSATEFPEVFDFETIKELKEMVTIEDTTGLVATPFAGAPVPLTETVETEGTMDRIMQRYFSTELPLLIEKSIENVLKYHSIIKPTTILLSGSLQEICCVEILKLIASNGLTGKFFAFSAAGSAEIYFDRGLVAYALTSRHGRPPVSQQEITDELGEGLGERISEALTMVADLKDGGFFFEKMAIPAALLDMPRSANVVALLLQGERGRQSGEDDVTLSDNLVFAKQSGDVLSCGLNEEEQRIFTIADGIRLLGDIISLSGLEPAETRKIIHRLAKVGILSNRGGI